MTNNEIFIIGGAGYVGRNIAKSLTRAGKPVTILSRTNPLIKNTEWIHFDALSYESYKNVNLKGATVINCAAVTNDDTAPVDSFKVNHQGATKLAEAIQDGKLVHISSSSVYNLLRRGETLEEHYDYFKYAYFNRYSQTKALAEHMLLKHSASNPETQIISLRPHGIYGKDDTTLLPRLIERIRWIRKGKKGLLFLPNRGEAVHSLTHIDNLTNAVLLALEYEQSEPLEAFNISDSSSVRISDAVTAYVKKEFPTVASLKFSGPSTEALMKLSEKFPKKFSKYEIAQVGLNKKYNIDKAIQKLGYKPEPFKVA